MPGCLAEPWTTERPLEEFNRTESSRQAGHGRQCMSKGPCLVRFSLQDPTPSLVYRARGQLGWLIALASHPASPDGIRHYASAIFWATDDSRYRSFIHRRLDSLEMKRCGWQSFETELQRARFNVPICRRLPTSYCKCQFTLNVSLILEHATFTDDSPCHRVYAVMLACAGKGPSALVRVPYKCKYCIIYHCAQMRHPSSVGYARLTVPVCRLLSGPRRVPGKGRTCPRFDAAFVVASGSAGSFCTVAPPAGLVAAAGRLAGFRRSKSNRCSSSVCSVAALFFSLRRSLHTSGCMICLFPSDHVLQCIMYGTKTKSNASTRLGLGALIVAV